MRRLVQSKRSVWARCVFAGSWLNEPDLRTILHGGKENWTLRRPDLGAHGAGFPFRMGSYSARNNVKYESTRPPFDGVSE